MYDVDKILIDNAHFGTFFLDSEGLILDANDYACSLFDANKEILAQTSIEDFLHQKTTYSDSLTQLYDGNSGKVFKLGNNLNLYVNSNSPKPNLPVKIEFHPCNRENGLFWAVYVFDLSELKKTQERLFVDELYLELIIEKTPASVAILDTEMNYVAVSQRWLKDFNLLGNELQGLNHYKVFPDLPERWKNILERCQKGENLMCEEDQFYRADGSIEWLYWEVCPWYTSKEEVGGIILFSEVITERKNAQDKLAELNEQLETKILFRTKELLDSLEREKQLNELKSSFVSMASHEFRTPLSAIYSSTSLAEKYTALEDQYKREKHLSRIRSSVKNMIGILDDFLSVDKLERGVISVQNDTLNIKEFLEDISEEIEFLLKENQSVTISCSCNEEVTSDKKLLRNILLNLLSNAVKYSEKNVELMAMKENDCLIIDIKDQGIGIPEHQQHSLFSKFFRAENVGEIQGTGLGLNIVRQYVDLLQGEILFTSEHNKGTVFTIRIPLTPQIII